MKKGHSTRGKGAKGLHGEGDEATGGGSGSSSVARDLAVLVVGSNAERRGRVGKVGRRGRMTNHSVEDVGIVVEEGKDVGAPGGKVRRLHLRNATSTVNKRGKVANEAVVTDTPKVLE